MNVGKCTYVQYCGEVLSRVMQRMWLMTEIDASDCHSHGRHGFCS
jgi:hypothetical protein